MRHLIARCLIGATLLLMLPALAQPPSSNAPWDTYLRAAWARPSQAVFVREWLVCGEFPVNVSGGAAMSANGTGLETDYLGGEAALKPLAGMVAKRPDGSEAVWTALKSEADSVDLLKAFAGRPSTSVVGYAYTVLKGQMARDAYLALGSDDGVAVWLNGVRVHLNRAFRGVKPDEDLVKVRLKDGDNAVLVKIEQGKLGWGFCFRVMEQGEALVSEKLREQPTLTNPPAFRDGKLFVNTDNGLTLLRGVHAPVDVLAIAPGGRIVAQARVPYGEAVTFDTARWARGPYQVVVRTTQAGGKGVQLHAMLYLGDALADAKALVAGAPTGDGSTELTMCHALLRDLVTDRLGAGLAAVDRLPRVYSALFEAAELRLEAAKRGTRTHGYGMVRLAYRDEIDDSAQFARVYLPANYDARRRYPLVVSLHGASWPLPPYYNFWGADRRGDWRAERYDCIMLYPHGRGNTTYRGPGERDVLRTIAETRKRFAIDDDRVYLTGESMGGGGTWFLGAAHPDLFAAIAPVYGGWDQRAWEPEGWEKADAWGRWAIDMSGTYGQLESLMHMPVFASHGDTDQVVSIENTRYAVRHLQRWGYGIRYQEVPGRGHESLGNEDAVMAWLLAQRRVHDPIRVRLRAVDLAHASAFWVRVDARDDANAAVHADAEVIAPNTIRLDTENARSVVLTPGAALVTPAAVVTVVWNGAVSRLTPARDGSLRLGTLPAAGEKRAGIEGGIAAAFNTPFAIVVGTISKDPLMQAMLDRAARRQSGDWEFVMRARPRVFRDTDMPKGGWGQYSLLLIGGPEENLVARMLGKDIPLRVTPEGFVLCGRAVQARDAYATAVFPSPLAPDRVVVSCQATTPAGFYLRGTFSHESREDYLIGDGHGGVFVGGFGRAWTLDGALISVRDPKELVGQGLRTAPTRLTAKSDAPTLALADLLETEGTGAFNEVYRHVTPTGKPLSGGLAIPTWNANNSITYDLSAGAWARLTGTPGYAPTAEATDAQRAAMRMSVVITGDGQELYRGDGKPFDVDIAGVKTLKLGIALAGGDGMDAAWIGEVTARK